MSQRCESEGYSMINIQTVVQKSKPQDKKGARNVIPHPLRPQTKTGIQGESPPSFNSMLRPTQKYPDCHDPQPILHPHNPHQPPTPVSTSSHHPCGDNFRLVNANRCLPQRLAGTKAFRPLCHSQHSTTSPLPNQTLASSTEPQRFHRGSP